MKISFTTLSCPEWSWTKVLKEASRMGYDGIEVRGIQDELYLPKIKEFMGENLDNTLRDLKENGYDGWLSFEWEKRWHSDIEEPEIALPYFIQYIKRFL